MNDREVRMALHRGVEIAIRRAFRWSQDWLWPGDTGAENLIQVSVAEALYRGAPTRRPTICLEPTLSRIAPGVHDGDTRRVDIGLLRRPPNEGDDERYFCVIEVKKHPVRFDKDIAKICDILDAAPSVRSAYLVTYFQKHQADRYAKKSLAALMKDTRHAIQSGTPVKHHCHVGRGAVVNSYRDQHGRWEAGIMTARFHRI